MGVSVDSGFKLRKLVADKAAVLQYGTQQRSDYYFRFGCELARNGYIGDDTAAKSTNRKLRNPWLV